MKSVIKIIPFAGVIVLNILAQWRSFQIVLLKPFAAIIGTLLLANLIIAIILKVKDYFTYGISIVALFGITTIFLFPYAGELYLHNVIVSLYIGLFLVAFLPPILKIKPFTFQFSENKYPKAITEGSQFLEINLIINYIWAFLFAVSIVLTKTSYSDNGLTQTIFSTAIPIILQLAIGLPLTIKLPNILMQKIKGDVLHFTSIEELFQSMPLGLNKEKAMDIDIVVQFILSGKEPTEGYLTIKDQKCSYSDGLSENPTTTINSDSELWLKISNNEVSGEKAFMNHEYSVDGDIAVLLNFNQLFSNDEDDEDDVTSDSSYEIDFSYKTFEPNKIKNIVIFDGGPRGEKYSKTTYITRQFCKGAEDAGANIEYITLKDKNIKDCRGCYTCWTKTPGVCIFKDDMAEYLMKYRRADLVIFSSPLYIFSVTGIMKRFLDRLLPTMKPYMLIKDGHTMHPDRYPEFGEQGFVVFSAAGFPEVKNNFDGMISMFKMMASHNENMFLMGEFYLPAAETLVQPVYRKRKEQVTEACYNAGKDVVQKGKIDTKYMEILHDTGFSKKTFQSQADNFWESLEGKKSFLGNTPKLEE